MRFATTRRCEKANVYGWRVAECLLGFINFRHGLVVVSVNRFVRSIKLRRWEKLLHQAFLVGLEGFELLGFGGDQGVEAAQARGDAFLFFKIWEANG